MYAERHFRSGQLSSAHLGSPGGVECPGLGHGLGRLLLANRLWGHFHFGPFVGGIAASTTRSIQLVLPERLLVEPGGPLPRAVGHGRCCEKTNRCNHEMMR